MKMPPILILITLAGLVSCRGAVPLTPEGIPMAQVKGYVTSCRGKIQILNSNGSKTSQVYLPAGAIRLDLEAASEPGYHGKFAGDPAYMCSYISRHELVFTALPGRSYRLRLDETRSGQYAIEVREALNPRTVEAHLIDSKSTQHSIEERCGFSGLAPGCETVFPGF